MGEAALIQVLPLDDERSAEMRVWLAFAAASMADPLLRPTYAHGHDALGRLCRDVVTTLVPAGDVAGESARLHALLNGLAMHLVSRGVPEGVVAREVPTRHLNSLARQT